MRIKKPYKSSGNGHKRNGSLDASKAREKTWPLSKPAKQQHREMVRKHLSGKITSWLVSVDTMLAKTNKEIQNARNRFQAPYLARLEDNLKVLNKRAERVDETLYWALAYGNKNLSNEDAIAMARDLHDEVERGTREIMGKLHDSDT